MNSVRIKSAIRPLCDTHCRPMSRVEVVSMIATDVCRKDAFACEETGCQRQYDIDSGYCTVLGGHFQPETRVRVPCPNCERAMYLHTVEAQGADREWVCPHFGCDGSKQTRSSL